jgi:hypothetical protein
MMVGRGMRVDMLMLSEDEKSRQQPSLKDARSQRAQAPKRKDEIYTFYGSQVRRQ